ncbi:hypothetical protein NDU88_003436 [Pleurodeles waltl]|uniref:Uncharacterized protein n=1 Tax=Pleurodeles waltl TaxID=8319 RepID=A0AAV7WVB0_PLEWA|nr:hypothetical protein NDU88_003436 [Pleurodeles waltl]
MQLGAWSSRQPRRLLDVEAPAERAQSLAITSPPATCGLRSTTYQTEQGAVTNGAACEQPRWIVELVPARQPIGGPACLGGSMATGTAGETEVAGPRWATTQPHSWMPPASPLEPTTSRGRDYRDTSLPAPMGGCCVAAPQLAHAGRCVS